MLRNVLIILFGLGLAGLSFAQGDTCSNLPGQWNGKGRFAFTYDYLQIVCRYRAQATVAGSDNFTITIDKLRKTKNEKLCPSPARIGHLDLQGTCQDGALVINQPSSGINLTGNINDNGDRIHLSGDFDVKGYLVHSRLQFRKAN